MSFFTSIPKWLQWVIKIFIFIVICVLLKAELTFDIGVLKSGVYAGYKGVSFHQELVGN